MAAKTKSLSYLRVSGKGQVDGDGFPRQRDAIAKYAKANGIEVVEEFTDEGVSGTKDLDDRPGLAALLDRIESNGVRMVIVENASRLARKLIVSEVILGQFRELGVKVISADGGQDLTAGDDEDPTITLIRQVLGAVSQFEKAVIVLKLRAARSRIRRTTGKCEGRKAFGKKPGEVATLERILDMRRAVKGQSRMPYEKIAAELNAAGIPTRSGGQWKPGTIYAIVKAKAPQLTAALE